jgi:hypothetical protein
MNIPSRFIVTCLFVVMALTGQSIAAVRGAADATGKMVLCVGATSVVVYIDEQGQPTQAPFFCPDCTLSLMKAAPVGMAVLPLVIVHATPVEIVNVAAHNNVATHLYLSRAPPVVI